MKTWAKGIQPQGIEPRSWCEPDNADNRVSPGNLQRQPLHPPIPFTSTFNTHGLNLGNWHLRLAEDISADGRVIVGQGLRNGLVRGLVVRLPPWCSTADFNNDGDSGTDADIEAFFACLAGNCCATCWHLGSDFNADGDAGTDADIEAFFGVFAGQAC